MTRIFVETVILRIRSEDEKTSTKKQTNNMKPANGPRMKSANEIISIFALTSSSSSAHRPCGGKSFALLLSRYNNLREQSSSIHSCLGMSLCCFYLSFTKITLAFSLTKRYFKPNSSAERDSNWRLRSRSIIGK